MILTFLTAITIISSFGHVIGCETDEECGEGAVCLLPAAGRGNTEVQRSCFACNCSEPETQCYACNSEVFCDCTDSGYTGEYCETDVDECATGDNDCDNNAICTNKPGTYDCQCSTGYGGDGFTCKEIVDLAVGKPSYQPSFFVTNGGLNRTEWWADKGNDGDTDSNIYNDHCFHTAEEFEPYWYVDLEAVYTIVRVDLYNRGDCCADRAKNAAVSVAVTEGNWTEVAYKAGLMGASASLTVDNVKARYVKVWLKDVTTWLHLCEVETYGY